jgi:hypothetical protein
MCASARIGKRIHKLLCVVCALCFFPCVLYAFCVFPPCVFYARGWQDGKKDTQAFLLVCSMRLVFFSLCVVCALCFFCVCSMRVGGDGKRILMLCFFFRFFLLG